MTPKRAAALALAGLVLAVLVFASVVGRSDDPDESPRASREGNGRPVSGTGARATERDTARRTATGRSAGTSGRGVAGKTRAGAPTETETSHEPEWSVYLVRVRGGLPRRLIDAKSEAPQNPDWSPVGPQIVVAGAECEDCDAGLRLINADGSRSRMLRTHVANVADPSWSPRGQRLAVTRVGGVIYSIDARTGAAQRLTSGTEASEGPAWSPTAHKIAYARQVSAANWDVYVMNADGRGKRPITRGPRQELAPAWSPNGRKIAFQRQERSGVWAIYTANADGSDQKRVTFGRSSAEQPSWSPNGRTIAFVRVTLAGSRIMVIRSTDGRRPQAFVTPLSLEAAYPEWSPDGETIAFTGKHLHHE
jgi:TolB protein